MRAATRCCSVLLLLALVPILAVNAGVIMAPCDVNTDCATCAAADGCGWCSTTSTCLCGTSAGATGGSCDMYAWSVDGSTCANGNTTCGSLTSCSDCTAADGCGWCSDSSMCFNGTAAGPSNETCTTGGWNFATCAGCSVHDSCITCTMTGVCGWCPITSICKATSMSCPLVFTPGQCSIGLCEMQTGCGTCTATTGCGWCAPSMSCTAGNSTGSADGYCKGDDWAFASFQCEANLTAKCANHTACDACAATEGCGWCALSNKCLPGGAEHSADGYCNGTFWTTNATQCMSPANNCTLQGSCSLCVALPECGWCGETLSCELGTLMGDSAGTCNASWQYGTCGSGSPPPTPPPPTPPTPPPPTPAPTRAPFTFNPSCTVTSRAYFDPDTVPSFDCPAVAAEEEAFCTCIGGTWSSSLLYCSMPSTNNTLTTMELCFAAHIDSLLNISLTYYQPGANVYASDPCLAWSVRVAADYLAWKNASAEARSSTLLSQTCQGLACNFLIDLGGAGDAPVVCAFATVSAAATYIEPTCNVVCPDGTCSLTLAQCACVKNATLSKANATFERNIEVRLTKQFPTTAALRAVGFATYMVPTTSTNCSGTNLAAYLTFSWEVNSSSGVRVYRASSSVLVVPALTMTPDVTYTLTMTVTGLLKTQKVINSWTFLAVQPTPLVSIVSKLGGVVYTSTTASLTIPVLISDPYRPATPTFTWACTSSTDAPCPPTSSGDISGLTIPVGSSAGEFTITFTYRPDTSAQASSSLLLNIVDGVIPVIQIVSSSKPADETNVLYLPLQTINLGAFVTYSSAFTRNWTVNGVNAGSSKYIAIDASTMLRTVVSNGVTTPVLNTVMLTVASTRDPTLKAVTTYTFLVGPNYDLSLELAKDGDPSATDVLALVDVLLMTTKSRITTDGAPFHGGFFVQLGYNIGSGAARVRSPLVATPTGVDDEYWAVAPYPRGASPVTVTFYSRLYINGIRQNTTETTFLVTKPTPGVATAKAKETLGALSDPVVGVSTCSTMDNLFDDVSSDPTAAADLADAGVAKMREVMTGNFGALLSDAQGVLFGFCKNAVKFSKRRGRGGSGFSRQLLDAASTTADSLSMAESAMAGSNFDVSNAQTFLELFSAAGAADSINLLAVLAALLSQDTSQALGSATTISADNMTITSYQSALSDLAGALVSSSEANVTLPADFTLAGVDGSTIVGVTKTELSDNVYGNNTDNQTALGSLVVLNVYLAGSSQTVSNLTTPISIQMGSSGRCEFFNTTSGNWSTEGLTSRRDPAHPGFILCLTTHLTAFSTFPSSGALFFVSLLSVLVVAAVQLLS